MRARSAQGILPSYSSGTATLLGSPQVGSLRAVDVGGTGAATMPDNAPGAGASRDAVMLDIETASDEVNSSSSPTPPAGRRWFRSHSFTSTTAVFSQLGSAVSSIGSRTRGALLGTGSSLVKYIHRVPVLDQSFDLEEIRPGDHNYQFQQQLICYGLSSFDLVDVSVRRSSGPITLEDAEVAIECR
ncbi:hypothetical protein R1sor_015428 [Riccia sorocarpa]|uniref:Uncharacterized protein n=1 Tax=Riccia sorocarpa TaxID=122646 RepID=A0ABD3HID8_9MARC